jgi:hypothetical protein
VTVGVGEAGQQLELHAAEIALDAWVLFDLVLEQTDGFREREVGPQLLWEVCALASVLAAADWRTPAELVKISV